MSFVDAIAARNLRRANSTAAHEIRPFSLYLPGTAFLLAQVAIGDKESASFGVPKARD